MEGSVPAGDEAAAQWTEPADRTSVSDEVNAIDHAILEKCFDRKSSDERLCLQGGVDCFGLYKVQKGFKGLVTNTDVQVRLMYPFLKIWQRG